MRERYKIVRYSESGHCCFTATVVDTESSDCVGDDRAVCECFDLEDARLICGALNAGVPR